MSPLPEQLALEIRTAGGEALILDARRGRALLSDSALIEQTALSLRAIGFERLIDFTAQHLGEERFSMGAVLRCPREGHSALVLKWTYNAFPAPALNARPPAAPEVVTNGHNLAEQPGGNGDLSDDAAGNGAITGEVAPPQPSFRAHPSLSRIWPAAGVLEREIFEMFGIVFAGNENLAPLLLEEQFQGFPLRRDYAVQQAESYAAGLLRERHEQALLERRP